MNEVIGYYSLGLCGVEVLAIDEQEEKVTYRFNSGNSKKEKSHRAKIRYNTKGAYFLTSFGTVRFSDVLRTNI